MENQFVNQPTQNYFKRRFAVIIVFAVFFIMLGRHLTFLPTINLSTNPREVDLKIAVEEIIKNKKGSYSIYFKDLKSDKFFGINENQINTAASVNKLPIIATLYYLDYKNKISLDDQVTIQKEDVQDYGTGSIRYQEMPQTYSLRNLAKLSLKESDNTAAHVINVKIGEENVQKLVDTWGMKQTNMADNKTTAYDMSILLNKIYNNQIASAANTKELLEFMTETDFEDRLTKDLPEGVKVHHKSGDGEGFVHDVGIIETKNGAYYLGVMTSDVNGKEDEAKKTIAQVSKRVFEALNN
jgi:beta-lactamase class A